MPVNRRRIPASQLAHDYGVSLNEFSESLIGLIGQEWATEEVAHLPRRREICAAVSAAMMAALQASSLSAEERDKLQPLLGEVLLPFWTRHCAGENPELADWIAARARYYLSTCVDDSRVKSAANVAGALLDALQSPEPRRPALLARLVPAFAHRMVGDVYRLDEVRRTQGIEMPLLAALCGMLQFSLSCDPILRALRLL
jgi:hypothetical protein